MTRRRSRSQPPLDPLSVAGPSAPGLPGSGRVPPAKSADRSVIFLEGAGHGAFSQVSSLNPAFRPGVLRIKITLRISCGRGTQDPGALVDLLSGFLPSLSFHRCCGDNSLQETFFDRSGRRNCAMRESDEGVDLAHLVEHVMIDMLHFIARMKTVSGVTCAYTEPPDRYDIFVECLEERLGRTCAGMAVDLVNDLLAGLRPDPKYLCMIHVARVAHENAGWPTDSRLGPLRATWGSPSVASAVDSLRTRGFLEDLPASFNFSGRPLLAYIPSLDSVPV